MNILIMTDYFPPQRVGGVGEVAKALASGYRRLGHDVFILTTGQRDINEDCIAIVRSHPNLITGVIRNNWLAPRLIKRHKIDLVHSLQSSSMLFLPFLGKRRKTIVLSTPQAQYKVESAQIRPVLLGNMIFKPNWREYLEKYVFMPAHRCFDYIGLKFSDCISVLNQSATHQLPKSPKPLSIIPNGISSNHVFASKLDAPDLDTFVQGKDVLLFNGVFRTRKRLPALLLALQDVIRTHPKTVLIVLGGGRQYDLSARHLGKSLGLENHVWFAGSVPQIQVRSYLGMADIYCSVSSYEGMPIALLEAMSQGLACIGTRIPGVVELIENGESGLLVELDNIGELTTAITKLLDQPQFRSDLGNAAAKRVEKHFNWDDIAATYLEFVMENFKDKLTGKPM